MKCKICNEKVSPFFDAQLNKTYYHCDNCEVVFLDKIYYITQDAEKTQYNNHNNSLENEGYVQMFESFLDFFWEDLENQPTLALDFGCGPGPVLQVLLKRRGLTCNIYDKFYQPKKIYENQYYDLITSTEVFEHLQDPIEVLSLFKKHLRPKGYVALMSLFHSNKQEDFLKWWYRRDPTHIIFFRAKTFEILARKCGFEVIKTDNKRIVLLRLK